MDSIDVKYIHLISARLEKYKRVKPNLYNFRCPICGDSKKNKSKARGYIYSAKRDANFKCHNCGAGMTFNSFLKTIDVGIHRQYCIEKFKEGKTGKSHITNEPKFVFEKPKFSQKISLPLCSEVEIASTYLKNRKVDPTKFYFAENFAAFVETFREVSHKNLRQDPRIIIPLYYDKTLVGFQGRSLNSKSIKYITVMLKEGAPKIYGLDNIEKDSRVYITEGPFDSTFIRNSIAMCGADADVAEWGICNPVFIYDNEPRNREILNRIGKTIDSGKSVVIWPLHIKEKDINDMVIAGHDVENLIKLNTYSGLEAKLKFNNWKRYE